MKLLEVEGVQSGIDYTVKDIDNLREQIGNVQKAVRNFYLLDDSLKGEGGDALRAFYRDCHEPFLILLHQSMIDYQTILTQMSEAINSFESSESGYVKQEYIENDVEDGLENVKDTAIKYTDEANSIIDSVSDIVSITPMDESKLVDEVQKGKKNAEEIVEELYALDAEQVKALASVKEDLNDMRNFISELETLFEDGDLSVENYNVTAVMGLDSFRSVSESVYGEGGLFGLILKKMQKGESINAVEREYLYHYFQNEILNDEKRKEIEYIASLINEDDIHKIKERLNEEVIVSQESIMTEIAKIQAFLFTDRDGPDVNYIASDSRAKLEAYLTLLENYFMQMIGNGNKAKVKMLNYEYAPNNVHEHVLETTLEVESVENDDEDFWDEFSNQQDIPLRNPYLYEQEVTYFTSTKASGFQSYLETQKLKNEHATYTSNFIVNKIVSEIVGSLGKTVSTFGDILITVEDYNSGKRKNEREITINEATDKADFLGMELSVSQSRTVPGTKSNAETEVQLYPTKTTYEILERWKKVYEINPNIPYPEDHVHSQDWDKVSEVIIETDFGPDLRDYIGSGTEAKPYKELAREYER